MAEFLFYTFTHICAAMCFNEEPIYSLQKTYQFYLARMN